MRTDRLKRTAVAALAAALLSAPAAAQEVKEISYGLPSKSLISSVPRIADELGLFAENGLKPNFTYIDTTAGTATALLSNSVDFAMTGTTEVIAAAARGQTLLLVSPHYNGLAGSLVVAKPVAERLGVAPDAPVEERLKALDGVLIASTSKVSSYTVSYQGAAASVGAEPRFTYMAVNAMNAALETGAVEAAVLTAPFWTVPVLKGTAVLWISPPKGELDPTFMPSTPGVTATTVAYAEAHPETVEAVRAVFDAMSAAFLERPDEVKAAIVKLFPDMDTEALDLVFEMEAQAFAATPLTPESIVHDIAYMKASGENFGPIDSVDPASVLFRP
jgi:ABC-type nitrate/sulfonate/bicarbonate transport system substrate-binding protein